MQWDDDSVPAETESELFTFVGTYSVNYREKVEVPSSWAPSSCRTWKKHGISDRWPLTLKMTLLWSPPMLVCTCHTEHKEKNIRERTGNHSLSVFAAFWESSRAPPLPRRAAVYVREIERGWASDLQTHRVWLSHRERETSAPPLHLSVLGLIILF